MLFSSIVCLDSVVRKVERAFGDTTTHDLVTIVSPGGISMYSCVLLVCWALPLPPRAKLTAGLDPVRAGEMP